MSEKIKTIYNMSLHEQVQCGEFVVTRVAGGWIYSMHSPEVMVPSVCTFVPFNNEFQE